MIGAFLFGLWVLVVLVIIGVVGFSARRAGVPIDSELPSTDHLDVGPPPEAVPAPPTKDIWRDTIPKPPARPMPPRDHRSPR